MKNRYTLVLIALLILVLTSCKKTETEIEASYLTASVEKLPLNPEVKWVVVLPGLGCHGCIQEAELFMQNYVKKKNIVFVLTKIESLKILQKKTGVHIKEHSNIYIDKKNEFVVPTNNSIYPCIVQIEDGALKKHQFQSPKNGKAFDDLKNHIQIEE